MNHLVVVNPKSFKNEADMLSVVRDIRAYFDSTGEDCFIYVSRYPRDAIRFVNKHVNGCGGLVRVYAVGGDGILYDCLNGLIGLTNAQLAVLPYGTANDFVRAFGEGKQEIFRDITKQAAAGVVPTDVIRLGSKCALSFCCIGIEAAVLLKYFEIGVSYPLLSKLLGKHLYMAGVPLAFTDRAVTRQSYELMIDGERRDDTYISIGIANAPCYSGNKTPFPMAHPGDGVLEVMTVKSVHGPLKFVKVNNYTKGKYYKYPELISHVSAKQISVCSDTPLYINADGESYYDAKIDAKIMPAAVNIVAPDGLCYIRRRNV